VFALTRILVPSNLGEPSKAAVRYGVAFARRFGAKLFLLHVLDQKALEAAIETERVIETLLPERVTAAEIAPAAADLTRNVARESLGRLLSRQEEDATHAEYVLRSSGAGGAGEAVVACATELDVELIVMGKHRLSFVEHLFAGSVAERVVRRAPCPVLIVQHPEHEFVVEAAPEGGIQRR
jgi:nucleotide-binding universal stress UspA family protein